MSEPASIAVNGVLAGLERYPPISADARPDAPAERYLESEDVGLDWDYIFWRGSTFASLLAHLSAPLSPKPSKRGLRNALRGAFKRS